MTESVTRWLWTPASSWQSAVVVACLLGTIVMFTILLRRSLRSDIAFDRSAAPWWQDRLRLSRRIAVWLSLAALLLLALAALDFRRETREKFDAPAVVLLLDESDSVRREGTLRHRELSLLSRQLTTALDSTDDSPPAALQIIRFSGSTDVRSEVPGNELSDWLYSDGTPTAGTDIASALHQAGDLLRRSERPGVVLLCSDGNQTTGDAVEAAERLAVQGIPVFVFPMTSPGPALLLHGASVPSTVSASAGTDDGGDKSFVRSLIRNSSSRDQFAHVEISMHHNATGETSPVRIPSNAEQTPMLFPAGYSRGLRQPLSFRGRGLQFVELKLTPVAESSSGTLPGKRTHRVCLPVYVQGRARLLVVGNDTRWTQMLESAAWEVTSSLPSDLLKQLSQPHHDFDVVTLTSVAAEQLTPFGLKELRRQVEQLGTGLLIINGDHGKAAETEPSVLKSYAETELEPILPVHPGPREHTDTQPARRVVIAVDASDSMSGRPMQIAHGICTTIINKLRPIDTLEVIAFNTVAWNVVSKQSMTSEGRDGAIDAVQRIAAGGGTDPETTLSVIQGLNLNEGAIVMISDGDMDLGYAQRLKGVVGAKVYTMAFGAQMSSISQSSALYHFDGRMAVPDSGTLPDIVFTPVEPQRREKFFERKNFSPGLRLLDEHDIKRGWLPDRSLPGHSVSTLSEHESTRLIGLHPENSDPILVFRDAGLGRVGVFTSSIPEQWFDQPDARKAVMAWCEEVSAFSSAARYWIDASREGAQLTVRMAAITNDNQPAFLDSATLALRCDGETRAAVSLKPDDSGMLAGSLQISGDIPDGMLHLWIREYGSRGVALSRAQRIPVVLSRVETAVEPTLDEDWTQGTNLQLLTEVAEAGGGRVLSNAERWPDLTATPPRQTSTHYWQELCSASAISLVLAVFLGGAFKS